MFCGNNIVDRPQQILEWFTRRWQIEVTFEEVRRHLGLETQNIERDSVITKSLEMI